jgi:hypothetical protein
MRTVSQLSVFVRNTKGALEYITNVLSSKGINIIGISTHEAFEYGVIRLVVSDPNAAETELKNAQVPGVLRNDILEVILEDQPGELHNMLRKLASKGVNVGYLYATSGQGKSITYIACDDLQKAIQALS